MKDRSFTKHLFITSLFINVLLSQSATVKGIIKDSGTQKPLVGANVFIKETSLGTATIDNGSYKISNVNPGTYILKATYIGYESKEMDITVSANETFEQDLALDYKTFEGKTIEVTAQARGQMDAINKQLKAKSIKNIISSTKKDASQIPIFKTSCKTGDGVEGFANALIKFYSSINKNESVKSRQMLRFSRRVKNIIQRREYPSLRGVGF